MDIDKNAEFFLLSERELKILLAGTSHSRVFGLFSEKTSRCDEKREDVLRDMAQMTRFNKIETDGEAFYINDSVGSIVSRIGGAEYVLSVSFPGIDLPLLYYCGEPAVLCKRVAYQPDMLRLKLCNSDISALELIADAELPDRADTVRELSEFDLWNKSGGEVFSAELFYQGCFQLRISVKDTVGEPLTIISEHMSGGKTECEYSKEKLASILSDYLRISDGGFVCEN
ncbi:MAG: hypothetical protein J1E34_03205 [Oscillospiraceae bacterium]|nr:hypothetical protein [Oscillospiraceae bacterium]